MSLVLFSLQEFVKILFEQGKDFKLIGPTLPYPTMGSLLEVSYVEFNIVLDWRRSFPDSQSLKQIDVFLSMAYPFDYAARGREGSLQRS